LYVGLWFSSLFWLCIVPLIMRRSVTFQMKKFAWPLSIAGLFLFIADWYALIVLRERGVWVLLTVFLLVWSADIGAYFFGRAFGKNKLAPRISPGKSVEGVIGGALVVVVIGSICWSLGDGTKNFFDMLGADISYVRLFFVMIFLCGLSVIGDLFESQLKRLQGMKDSSQLLPGHGGVLDRIDALMPVLPFAALLILGLS
jgi:phosphatidate cytidylyltransferase